MYFYLYFEGGWRSGRVLYQDLAREVLGSNPSPKTDIWKLIRFFIST